MIMTSQELKCRRRRHGEKRCRVANDVTQGVIGGQGEATRGEATRGEPRRAKGSRGEHQETPLEAKGLQLIKGQCHSESPSLLVHSADTHPS